MLGQACVIILGFADNIMIGWYGVNELASASFVNGIMNLFIFTELGFCNGMTPVIGAGFGRKDYESIARTVRSGITINSIIAAISILLLAAIYFFIDDFGQEEALLPIIKPYFVIVGISTIFALGFNTLKQFTDGICQPVISMVILMCGNLLNIIGNWFLIYGKYGFPELGLTGAGISTLFSRIVMFAAFAAYLMKSKRFSSYSEYFRKARTESKDMKHLFNMGYPLALQTGMETSTFTISTVMIGWLGATALAAHQVALTISQIFFMMLLGLSSATSVLISSSYGRHDLRSVNRYATKGYMLSVMFSATFCIIIYIFRHQVIGLFTESQEVISMSLSLIFVLFSYQFGDSLQLLYCNALRGIQDVKPIMAMAFVSYFLIAIPAAYLLGFTFRLGVVGVWIGFPVGLTIAGIFYFTRFKKQLARLARPAAM